MHRKPHQRKGYITSTAEYFIRRSIYYVEQQSDRNSSFRIVPIVAMLPQDTRRYMVLFVVGLGVHMPGVCCLVFLASGC